MKEINVEDYANAAIETFIEKQDIPIGGAIEKYHIVYSELFIVRSIPNVVKAVQAKGPLELLLLLRPEIYLVEDGDDVGELNTIYKIEPVMYVKFEKFMFLMVKYAVTIEATSVNDAMQRADEFFGEHHPDKNKPNRVQTEKMFDEAFDLFHL